MDFLSQHGAFFGRVGRYAFFLGVDIFELGRYVFSSLLALCYLPC